MTHEEICTFEVAKLAKEKGFRFPSFKNYDKNGVLITPTLFPSVTMQTLRDDIYAAPTQSLLQRWLREEKGCIITIGYHSGFSRFFWMQFDTEDKCITSDFIDCEKLFKTYELALEDALKYALENLV